MRTEEAINILGDFCGKRDVPRLTREALREHCGFDRADVFVLFGGSILEGGEVLAEALREGVAEKYVIVGGAGHTTPTLRAQMRSVLGGGIAQDASEAALFDEYIFRRHGLRADALETRSTNCGNNITNLLTLLRERDIPCGRIILTQDATMQRRMEAVLRKYVDEKTRIVNYAAYHARVCERGGRLVFAEDIRGMWDMERYIGLLMGEIPRLTDDENGYGPRGRDFLVHVDIPARVREAFELLRESRPDGVRIADARFG